MTLRDRLQATLGDTYRLEREIGGGMSRVFVAEETALGPLVALFDPKDAQHGRCVKVLKAAREPNPNDSSGADGSISHAETLAHRSTH